MQTCITLSTSATLHKPKFQLNGSRLLVKQQWNYCEQAIQGLMGKWGGELDTFYTDLLQRVMNFKENPPENWDYILVKNNQE
jgi:hypothetical protein